MRPHLAAALAFLAASASNASSDPIALTPAKDGSREMEIVKAKYPDLGDAKVQVAIVELGSDKAKESSLVARFTSAATCADGDENGACRTVVMKVAGDDWKAVFDRKAKTLEFGDVGYAGMKNLVVNGGYETWTWSGSTYGVDVEKMGAPVATAPAPKASVDLLIRQFGTSVERLQSSKHNVEVLVANVSLHDKKKQILVRLEGPGVCGLVMGCPWRVLENAGGSYKTVLDGFGTKKFAVLPVVRDGWHDIVASTPRGFVVFGWGGEAYAVADQYQGGK